MRFAFDKLLLRFSNDPVQEKFLSATLPGTFSSFIQLFLLLLLLCKCVTRNYLNTPRPSNYTGTTNVLENIYQIEASHIHNTRLFLVAE